jgi:hypothetical protein
MYTFNKNISKEPVWLWSHKDKTQLIYLSLSSNFNHIFVDKESDFCFFLIWKLLPIIRLSSQAFLLFNSLRKKIINPGRSKLRKTGLSTISCLHLYNCMLCRFPQRANIYLSILSQFLKTGTILMCDRIRKGSEIGQRWREKFGSSVMTCHFFLIYHNGLFRAFQGFCAFSLLISLETLYFLSCFSLS